MARPATPGDPAGHPPAATGGCASAPNAGSPVSRRASLWLLAGGLLAGAGPALGDDDEDQRQAAVLLRDVAKLLADESVHDLRQVDVARGCLAGLRAFVPPDFAATVRQTLRQPENAADLLPLLQVLMDGLGRAVADKRAESRRKLMEQLLHTYLRGLDRYSGFKDAATWELIKKLEEENRVGLGTVLMEEPVGHFHLYPYPAEPADLAGVVAGDELVEVDGAPVAGQNLYRLAARLLGDEGSSTTLTVRQEGKEPRQISVSRTKVRVSPIELKQGPDGLTIRIRKFTLAAAKEIQTALRSAPPSTPLVLDLRGCPGGEMDSAVLIAFLLLPEGCEIGSLVTANGKEQVYRSTNREPFRPKSIRILMDGGTASAAELLISALTTNLPTITSTQGTRTFGKGMTQQESVLHDAGGAVTFSDRRLRGPGGVTWEGTGIDPQQADGR